MYYSNFQRYDAKGRRVALFGQQQSDGTFKVTVITCSKHDQFSKAFAQNAYQALQPGSKRYSPVVNPEYFSIPVEDFNKPRWSFLKWCKENYFTLREAWINLPSRLVSIDAESCKLSKCFTHRIKYLTK